GASPLADTRRDEERISKSRAPAAASGRRGLALVLGRPRLRLLLRLEVLEAVHHHPQRVTFAVLRLPGVQLEVALQVDLLTPPEGLQHPGRLLALLAPVPDLAVDEHGHVFPLPGVLVEPAIVSGKPSLRALAAEDRFQVPSQPPDQHDLG